MPRRKTDYGKPEQYLSDENNMKIDTFIMIQTYNHFRAVTKRILKNRKDFAGMDAHNYHIALQWAYPPANKIRTKEYLAKYLSDVCYFLKASRGAEYGYTDDK